MIYNNYELGITNFENQDAENQFIKVKNLKLKKFDNQ